MRKQGVILVIATLMAVILCGAASAADSSTTGGEGLSDVNGSDASPAEAIDPTIWVQVNYEYAQDDINPGITVKDSSNNSVVFDKTEYPNNHFKINFTSPGVANGTKFLLTVTAPGYITQTQKVDVNQAGTDPMFYGDVTFDMKATENYKLGREVTAAADNLLNFANADEVLCITTAGLAYRNGTTTEDCLEGVLNGLHGKISYGQGNILTFQSTRTDPVDFCFIVRNGSALTAAFFKNGSLTPAYLGTFSAINQALWDNTIKPTLGDNAFGYVSLANAWKEGLSTDILRQAAYHGHVCLGTISGQAMISLLLKYYPHGVYGNAGELEATSYRAVGVPGNSDDDAYIYSLDLTTGKRSWVGYNTAEDNMVGFIRWCPSTNLGTLIIMRFNEEAVVQLYKQQTGNTAYSGIAGELAFNTWLINKLETDPDSLVEILYVFDNITPAIHNNLTGGVDSKKVVCDALGLDMDYILGLGLTNIASQRVATNYATGNLTPEQIKQIGIDAANQAIALFAVEGINLEKDDYDLTVFTTAGYVRVNEQVMDMAMDGIYQILGSRLSRATLLPVHNARYNPLYFQFSLETLVNGTKTVISKTLTYNPENGTFTAKNESSCIIDQVILYDPPYDALMAWLWHNHVCGGSSPGYLITNYIYDNFPIGEDESYALIGTSISCRDDIYSYLLGISPGAGTYFSQRMTSDTNGKSVLILSVFDSATNTRRVAIIDWEGPSFAKGSNSYEEYIKLYKGDYSSPNLISAPTITLSADTWVTEEEWQRIIAGGDARGDSLNYIKGLPVRTKDDLIKIQGGTETQDGDSNQGTSTGTSNGSVLVTSTGTGGTGGTGRFSTGSVGTTGAAVNAATETTTTEAGAQPAGDTGKSYEVTQAGTENNDNTPWGTYAIVGIVSVLALGAVGFFFKGSLFGR
ncbi:FmdE family protein [Methanobacterium subterraneum]|uniref:FmdE family protein n=1 Tax=Methanobacterium subterraneum TaxID=59277 RepID=UPI000C2D4B77|nr:FmdE family protein [Methanobacterium subterraneum]